MCPQNIFYDAECAYTYITYHLPAGLLGTPTFIAITTVSLLAVLLVLACICCAVTCTVAAVWWCRQRREGSNNYDTVLAHGTTTTMCQPTTAPKPAYSKTFGSEEDSFKDVTLLQHQEQMESAIPLHSSWTAQRPSTFQVQPYAVLSLPNGEEGMVQSEGMHDVEEVDRTGLDTVGGADMGGGKTAYKELDLKSLEVHPYTSLDVSTLRKEEMGAM